MLYMTNTAELEKYATNFFPNKDDLSITYACLQFYEKEVEDFSNLDVCFHNCMRYIEKRFKTLSI